MNDSKQARIQIAVAKSQLMQDIDNIGELMLAEEKRNASLKRRLLWLIPYNFGIIWATLRYCGNVNSIARKWWPSRQKVKVSNLFMVATIQAVGFTTIYLGGTFAVLGINPIKKIKELKEEQRNPKYQVTLASEE